MNFKGLLDEREFDIEIRRGDGNTYRIFIDGEEHVVDLTEPEPGLYSLLDGNTSVEAVVRPDGERVNVDLAGRRYEITLEDPMLALTRGARHAVDGTQLVRAAMAGKVLDVLVAKGDVVEQGAPLLVIEAMKMENEIRSPKAGTVTALEVTPGSTVEANTHLLTID